MKKLSIFICVMTLILLIAGVASANTIPSSTMWFQGPLTYNPTNGSYTTPPGGIPAIPGYYYVPGGPGTTWNGVQWVTPDGRVAEGGFDVYGKEGAIGYMDQNNDGDFDEPNEQTIITNHDAYSQGGAWGQWWDPDVPDEQNYHLELNADMTWRVWAFSDLQPPPHHETPYEGTMNWSTMIASESNANWNPIWTWGEEIIPLECPEFKVNVTNLGGGIYRVSLIPLCPMDWKDYNGEDPGGYMPDIDQNQNFSVGRNLRFDFNTASSPTMTGWTGVLPTKAYTGPSPDYGWDTLPVNSIDRGATFNALERDLHYYDPDRTFIVDLPKNIYTVTVYIGDRGQYFHDDMYVTIEGKVIGPIDTAAGEVQKHSVTVPVEDGQLNILFEDRSTLPLPQEDPNWVVIGIEIVNANYCAPVAEANSLWWLDKRWDHIKIFADPENGLGYIGQDMNNDGKNDILDLVQELAWFKDTNGQRTCQTHTGTTVGDEQAGIDAWLEEYGLSGKLYEHTTGPAEFPDPEGWLHFFNYLEAEVERCQDVKLDLGFWHIEYCDGQPGNGMILWKRVGGHAVTVAGVDSPNLLFAISDPDNDAVEAGITGGVVRPLPGGHLPHPGDPTVHNIEANASHDFYAVGPSPSPGSNLGLIGFPGKVNLPEGEQGVPIPIPWPPDFPCYESMIVTEIEHAVIVSPKLLVCGNGLIEPGETCDPPGLPGPGPQGGICRQNCTYCGDDGILPDPGEQCDDGNGINNDACTNNCMLPFCGDGIIGNTPGETCDPPGLPGPGPQGGICRQNCTYCGDDGILPDPGEQCDDGNGINNDGCRNNCMLPVCGDGIVQPALGEQCDDGNLIPGDGCSPTCQFEPDISVSPGSLIFGAVVTGGSSTKTVTISNTGGANLNISKIEITGVNKNQFSVATGTCPSLTPTIAPAGSCTINATFSPTATGNKTASLDITSDDPDESLVSVPLSGTGANVVVTSPKAGDILKVGTIHTIKWDTGTGLPVAKVKLFYTKNKGLTWILIKTILGNPGSLNWKVPAASSRKCKVKVILKNAAGVTLGSDKSDGLFTITP